MTLLHRAIESGEIDLVKLLVEEGANLSEKDGLGNAPLHIAVIESRKEIASLLLGADVNSKNNDGKTPLHIAANNNNLL